MISEEKQLILRAVEEYARSGNVGDGLGKVTCLPDNKTSCIEQTDGEGRSIMLDEYHVDDKIIWAGYSGRTGRVYLSLRR